MAVEIEAPVRRLLDEPNMAHVATLERSGGPRVQPTWIGTDGTSLFINTQEGRIWPLRVRRDPRIALTVPNREQPAEYVEIVGRVVEETTEGAKDHVDELSRTYLGIDYPRHFEGEVRLVLRIEPERINYVNLVGDDIT